ncbi:MAG: TSUP family transporter [Pseudomonadota bacterium]
MDFPVLTAIGSPWLIVVVFVIVFLAAIVQAGLGLGFGLLAAPLLALVNPELVPAPTLILGFLTAGWGVLRERQGIAWNEVGIGSIGRAAGVVVAAVILANITDRETFMLMFGLMIAIAVGLSVSGWRVPFSGASLISMGVVSGLMGTITSVGSPPMALIYQNHEAKNARPTMAAFFMIGCAFSLIGLAIAGWAGWQDLIFATLMLPPMLAGLAFVQVLGSRFDGHFRMFLLAISGLAAVVLIVRGLA